MTTEGESVIYLTLILINFPLILGKNVPIMKKVYIQNLKFPLQIGAGH